MNRKLLFLGIILGIIAIVSSIVILFVAGESKDTSTTFAFQAALQIHLFHAVILMVLAAAKRKYTDQNLVITGWIFTFSVLLFSIPAYLAMFNEIGVLLFNTVGIIGGLGFVIGWILLAQTFYSSLIAKSK